MREQVNISLDNAQHDLLEAIAYVERVRPSTLLKPVVERFLEDQRLRPEVQAALHARTLAAASGDRRADASAIVDFPGKRPHSSRKADRG
jgi:hypothetical protein